MTRNPRAKGLARTENSISKHKAAYVHIRHTYFVSINMPSLNCAPELDEYPPRDDIITINERQRIDSVFQGIKPISLLVFFIYAHRCTKITMLLAYIYRTLRCALTQPDMFVPGNARNYNVCNYIIFDDLHTREPTSLAHKYTYVYTAIDGLPSFRLKGDKRYGY